MKTVKSYLNSVSLIALFFISGCSEEYITPQNTNSVKITVSGIATNYANQAVPNVRVKIGNDSVLSSSNGNFTFTNVTPPYDLQITEDVMFISRYYSGLTAENLRIPDIGYIDDSLGCQINISFPAEILTSGVSGKMIFTDGEYVNAYDLLNQNLPLKVWLTDKSPVTGRIIVITYKKDALGKIVSYENFGQSTPMEVINGGKYNYNFSADELSLNPGEETVSGSIILQPGYSAFRNFYITFSDKLTPNFQVRTQFEFIVENNFSLKIPTGLPVQFSSMIGCSSYIGQQQQTFTDLFKLPPMQTGIVLETKSEPQLLTPEDNAVNIDTSSLFSFTPGAGTGIYRILLLISSYEVLVVYTPSNSFYLSDFKGLFKDGLPANTIIAWAVEKIGFANSINEYFTTFTDRPEYFKNYSALKRFTTAN